MTVRTRLDVDIDRPRSDVWAYIENIPTHVEWMVDATQIEMVGDRLSGVDAKFDCLTKIGPIRLHDQFTVTKWEDARLMEISHGGAFAGTGRFILDDLNGNQTRFVWEEEMHFAWWLGGPIGEAVAVFGLRPVWRRNLRQLKRAVESRPHS